MENTLPQDRQRLLSLDVFRGLTIAAMIVVNTPGNKEAYTQLDHAEWSGCTMTDLVFPFFLFIAGVSLVFSLSKRMESGRTEGLLPQILRRAAIIFGLGLFLNAIPNYHPSTIRILGVLQRIAICYGVTSILFIKTSLKTQIGIAAAALLGYWLAMTYIPVPVFGAGAIGSKEGNLAAFVDRAVLGAHTYRSGVYDPEGILSTIPSMATALLGVFTGLWLRSRRDDRGKIYGMLAAGAALAAAGRVWGMWFPINKALWTSSYVLFTAGLALFALAFCYLVIEVRGIKSWSKPFEIYGMNPIAAYITPILLLKFLVLYKLDVPGGEPIQLRIWLCDHIFGTWLSPLNASAAFAFSYAILWLVPFWLLYRKKIFIKI